MGLEKDREEKFGFDLKDGKRIEIGRGMAGETYRGWVNREGEKEPAALKCFGNWTSDEAYQMIKKEATLLRRLHHRGIVQAFGLYHDARTPILATRLIDGEKLTKLVERRSNHDEESYITEALRWAALLSDVLVHLKENEIVHRDIKPENILIRSQDPSGPVLLDFGIGKSIDGPNSLASTLSRGFTGSLPFASPEQFCTGDDCPYCKRKKCAITPKTDVYGLGATLWYVFSGKFPVESFQGREYGEKSIAEKMARARREAKLEPADLPTLPELRTLLRRMLEPDADDRPGAEEVYEGFRDLYESRGQPLFLETQVEMNLRDWTDHLDQLPPFKEIEPGVQISIQPIDYFTHRVWSRDQLQIDFDHDDGPFRISFEEAMAFIKGLNANEKDFEYRLPEFSEWEIAAGSVTRLNGSGGRKCVIEEVGSELEWCTNRSGKSEFAECRWTAYLGRGEAQLNLRHKEWPKGILRLVREPREN